jgi:hypothetical protein
MDFTFFNAVRWDLPALMLGVLLVGFLASLVLVQRRPNFDFAEMYKDDAGKVSASRVLSVGAWVASTWYVMQDMMDGVPTPEVFWGYCIVWSAAKVLDKAAEKWNGSLPFGK